MKNLKSLILGSAAGMLAVAGAQAADLPVKAKPVEYVKVCSAYGAGFYYIPGTDICLRVGGFIFSDFSVNDRGDTGRLDTGQAKDRNDSWNAFRIRQALILDARTNTEYGTLRSYFSGGFQWDTTSNGQTYRQSLNQTEAANWSWYYNAAFIQFAGFTFGIANSFFDFDPHMTMHTFSSKSVSYSSMIGYTAQLGSGLSASISMEDATARRNAITNGTLATGGSTLNATAGTIGFSGVAADAYSGQFMPDFVANLRVDQAWGDAQIAGAVHQVKTNTITPTPPNVAYGYAFMGGLNFKLPSIGAKDSFQLEGVWSKGAISYAGTNASGYTKATNWAYNLDGKAGPTVDLFDAYLPTTGSNKLELVKAYSANAQFRHFWTSNLRSTIGYGWTKIDAGPRANADSAVSGALGGFPDGKLQQVVGNLIWSPVKNLDIGTEVYYSELKATNSAVVARNGSADWWGGNFRVTRYW